MGRTERRSSAAPDRDVTRLVGEARARIEVKHLPDTDGLGPEAWYVSVRTLDGTWTFLSAHDSQEAANQAAEIVEDAIAAALESHQERLNQITDFTLERSALVPESLRGDRDWWQQNAVYWREACQAAWNERDEQGRRACELFDALKAEREGHQRGSPPVGATEIAKTLRGVLPFKMLCGSSICVKVHGHQRDINYERMAEAVHALIVSRASSAVAATESHQGASPRDAEVEQLREALAWALNKLDRLVTRCDDGSAYLKMQPAMRVELVGYSHRYGKARAALHAQKSTPVSAAEIAETLRGVPHASSPRDGVCCSCGYEGHEETPCLNRDDRTHCEHWWDGETGGA